MMKSYAGEINILGKECYIGRMTKIFYAYYDENYKIQQLDEFGAIAYSKIANLPRGFCHGDYGLHNMKKSNGKLYVFDFDVASGSYPMFDIACICDTSNFWKFNKKDQQKVEDNVSRFAETYTKYCDLSQLEIDAYLYFLALRQYEVRATVAFKSIYKMGTHFLNENYLNSLHSWMTEFMDYVKL